MRTLAFTLRDFSLRENHLAGYPSLLSQEHNIRFIVRLLADAHPNLPSANYMKLNIMWRCPNSRFCYKEVKNGRDC